MPKVAAASETHVAQAALEALRRGNATDAIVTAVLVAAAASPGVLLGPVQILAGGAGTGLVVVDGRVRQPGHGSPRPRGFLEGTPIPPGAYVGAPALPAALAAALGSLGTSTMSRASGPGISWAKANAPERVAVLDALRKRGGLGLSEDGLAVELLGVGGRAVGGMLTRDDLSSVRPAVERLSERSLAPAGILKAPWSATEGPEGSHVQVVAACDARGRVAIACYETPDDGLPIPALGLVVPRHAAPVMRGARRVAPGTPRPAAAPVALRVRAGSIEAAVGVARMARAQAAVDSVLAALEQSISMSDLLATIDGGCPVVLAGLHGSPQTQIRARSTP